MQGRKAQKLLQNYFETSQLSEKVQPDLESALGIVCFILKQCL
jgi:hypothetical protein